MSLSRRQFLTHSGWFAAGLGCPVSVAAASASKSSARGRPRRIIHLVSDGMSLGTLTCADHLSRRVRGRALTWMELYDREDTVSALVDMRSLNSLVTDSAAASSSWGSGSRVKNGALNMLPDGRELRPVGVLFGEEGWARGLVTTTEITHATPAGFAANVLDRGTASAVALQYLERRFEVLLGGGRQYFEAKERKDKRDLKAEFRAWGYQVMEHRDELAKASLTDRWLGIFRTGHLPFTVDRDHSPELQRSVPTLAEMTQRALERLERHGRFLLQVEGGRVDHGAHASDAAAALYDQIAFDEALDVCLEFQRRAGDTLVIVTTDHGNANLGLNGSGGEYGKTPQLFANLTRIRKSFAEIQKDVVKAAGKDGVYEKTLADGKTKRQVTRIEPKTLAQIIGEATGYEVPARKAELLARYLEAEHEPLYDQLDSASAQLGQLLGNYLGIGWTGSSHTSDYVPLAALGPGADRFRGFIRNTDVFRHYTGLARIKFRNPEAPLLAECGPSAEQAERWQIV